MEKPKLDWKTFTGRRRLDAAAWIKSKGFKSVKELKKWCRHRDMEEPADEEVSKYFKKPAKKKEAAVEEKPKKRGRPKKKVDEASE